MQNISKIDVAKRELEFAIRLFFLQGDVIVLHLIISACQEILTNLVGKDKSMRTNMLSIIKPSKKRQIENLFNEAYNFFKHSGRDSNASIKFNPFLSQIAILDSIEMYQHETKEVTGLMQAFRLWFYTSNPNYLLEEEQAKLYSDISTKINIDDRLMFLDIANYLENKRTNNI